MSNKTFAPFIRLVMLYLDPEGPLKGLLRALIGPLKKLFKDCNRHLKGL